MTPAVTPPPPPAHDPARAAANRRILAFVALFMLLLGGSVWLVLHQEKVRGRLIQPEQPAAPATEVPAPPKPPPAPPPPVTKPVSPALAQSEQMEAALTAYREAGEFLVAKQFGPAEDRALAALKAYPKLAGAQRILGLVYIQQGNFDRAISVLEAALRNEPFNPEALTNLAFAYLQTRNTDLALELIETCRRLHPDYQPALLQEGIMLLSLPPSERAITVLREAVAAFPNMPGPRNNLAIALARMGDREAAREQLQVVLEMEADNVSALFNMGAFYAQETNAPAAVPWLRRAMQHVAPGSFRDFLNDPDLANIRGTPEFLQLLQELDPAVPGPRP